MPKYTYPTSFANNDLITATEWNTYFGSIGNIQWLYDSYENVSSLNAAVMSNGTVSAVASNVISVASNYASAKGDRSYYNITDGTLTSPIYTGYVYLSAHIEHTIAGTPSLYMQYIPLREVGYSGSLVTTLGGPKQRFQTGIGPSPTVRHASYDAILHIANGFAKFRLGIYRTDGAISANTIFVRRFAILPLGDVSGLVNFLDTPNTDVVTAPIGPGTSGTTGGGISSITSIPTPE